jgi:hypothetical protein
MPKAINRAVFSAFVLAIAAMFTILSVYKPFVNAFAQMSLTVPIIFYVSNEIQNFKTSDKEVYSLGVRTLIFGVS